MYPWISCMYTYLSCMYTYLSIHVSIIILHVYIFKYTCIHNYLAYPFRANVDIWSYNVIQINHIKNRFTMCYFFDLFVTSCHSLTKKIVKWWFTYNPPMSNNKMLSSKTTLCSYRLHRYINCIAFLASSQMSFRDFVNSRMVCPKWQICNAICFRN